MPGGVGASVSIPIPRAMNPAPIGIFDSGIGGLTVARAIYERLPARVHVYFGDTARVPYGPKSPETVRRYSLEILDWLLAPGGQGGRDRLQHEHRPRARGAPRRVARCR